jgi:hypothetical protein
VAQDIKVVNPESYTQWKYPPEMERKLRDFPMKEN